MRLGRFLLLLILGCFIGAAPAFAQEELDEIYVAEDDSFEFLYPSDWEVDDSLFEDVGFVNLTGEIGRDTATFTFMSPSFIDLLDPRASDVEEAAEALSEVFEMGDIEVFEVGEREVVITGFELESVAGVMFVIDFSDGGFGGVLVSGEEEDSFEDEDFFNTVFSVVLSFNSVGANEGLGGLDTEDEEEQEDEEEENEDRDSSGSFPDELGDFDGEWQDAVAELQDEGIIASGGSLIFNENSAFFDGVGSWFTPLARNASRRDVVMAATLQFTSDSNDFESCSIMVRIENSGGSSVNTYLEIGITNDGEVYWVDAEDGDFESDAADLGLDLDEPHHLMAIVQLDSLNVYVDGELVFEEARVEERSGYFGIALLGAGAESRCEGTNVWAYDAPIFIEGFCEVVATGTVNKRSGPGTDFDRAGTMAAGERLEVVGQAEDSAGFIWYELEDESWVREDIISLQGDCGDIPESD